MPAVSGAVLETTSPATRELIGTFPASEAADVGLAVLAARRGFEEGLGRERLAALETGYSGKLYEDSLFDVDEAAYMFEYHAGWATKSLGAIPPVGPDAVSLAVKEPVGVAALISP